MGGAHRGKKQQEKEALPQRLSKLTVWQLVALLVVVVGGGVLFVGAASGWFNDGRVVLSSEVYCGVDCDKRMVDINTLEYDGLIAERRSFVLLVDQDGCKTAERLKEFIEKYAEDAGIRVYRMMFSDVKESSLYEYVKYYPSVVLISKGKVLTWLKADEDEDADKYNDYESFKAWMERFVAAE